MERIVVVDYGSGNVESVFNAMKRVHNEVSRSRDKIEIEAADRIVIPGVGSYENFMKSLNKIGVVESIQRMAFSGRPILGICVGMQALFGSSEEGNSTRGLDIIQGRIKHLDKMTLPNAKIPHVGWNKVFVRKPNTPVDILDNRDVYFMHSFGLESEHDSSIASTNYFGNLAAAVQLSNTIGIQFHPEKSHVAGLDFLESWSDWKFNVN